MSCNWCCSTATGVLLSVLQATFAALEAGTHAQQCTPRCKWCGPPHEHSVSWPDILAAGWYPSASLCSSCTQSAHALGVLMRSTASLRPKYLPLWVKGTACTIALCSHKARCLRMCVPDLSVVLCCRCTWVRVVWTSLRLMSSGCWTSTVTKSLTSPLSARCLVKVSTADV